MSEFDTPHDPELSRLYRESATAEPAAHLDAAILAAARRESARGGTKQRPWLKWRGWLVPVSVAAVAVLSLTLTLQVPREMERAEREAAPSPPLPQSKAFAPAPERAAPAPAAADAAAPVAGETARQAAPPAAVRRQERATGSTPSASAAKSRSVRSAERAVERREAFVPEPPSAVGAAQSPAGSDVPGAAAGVPAPFEAQPSPAPLEAGTPPRPAAGAAFKRAPAMSESEHAARERVAPEMSADEAMPAKKAAGRPPAQWLEDIRTQLRQGRIHEAATELAAFRRAYPGYVLPEDLRELSGR